MEALTLSKRASSVVSLKISGVRTCETRAEEEVIAGSVGEASGRSRSRNCANSDSYAYQGALSTRVSTARASYVQGTHRFLSFSVICHW